jgi:hypothetical protein
MRTSAGAGVAKQTVELTTEIFPNSFTANHGQVGVACYQHRSETKSTSCG